MRTRLLHPLALGLVAAVLLAVPATATADPSSRAAAPLPVGAPENLHTTVTPGKEAIEVTWDPPLGLPLPLAYDVLVDGDVVHTTTLGGSTSYELTPADGIELGHTYDIAVRIVAVGDEASTEQTLYIAPVTTVQKANPSNPLAGKEWGVYRGLQDPAYKGWWQGPKANQDPLAPIAMINKAKFFGAWITDGEAEEKTREYIENVQDGDPSRLSIMTLFRMFPWEGRARIDQRLPTAADQASYKKFVTGVAQGIGNDKVAVIVQPDGYFVKKAYDTWAPKVGKHKALLPARLLTWTAQTLAAQPHTTVYMDMGSEDWALGDAASVAKYLALSGVKYARGFSLDVSHKDYLDREILFAQQVSQDLAKMGLTGKHAVIDTSDNGQPFAGSEINPHGSHQHHYTAPGEIGPCTTKDEGKPCTALGVPPTTDVDNPHWHLKPAVARTAAQYVDAYLWVSRPWLPNQGTGGAGFSPKMASQLLKTWDFSPYFTGTP